MKFREFVSWCNQRAADGCWGMLEAMVCVDIIETVRKERFWKREKLWKEKYAYDVLEQIVNPIEKKIEEMARNR